MPILHYLEASPRGDASVSTNLALPVVRGLAGRGWTVDHLPLWADDLPTFDGAALDAKYARLKGQPLDGDMATAWETIAGYIARLDAADRVLISTPMWNFGIPYRLKHWIDLVTQPGLSFSFDPTRGYSPLLASKPVTVVLASAGDYSAGPSWGRPDLASPYLKVALSFLGLDDVEIVAAGPTLGDQDKVQEGGDRAARRLAAIVEAA